MHCNFYVFFVSIISLLFKGFKYPETALVFIVTVDFTDRKPAGWNCPIPRWVRFRSASNQYRA